LEKSRFYFKRNGLHKILILTCFAAGLFCVEIGTIEQEKEMWHFVPFSVPHGKEKENHYHEVSSF